MKKTLELTIEQARNVYKDSPESLKKILEENFGKENLALKITDRIKTFEDACRINGVNPCSILPYQNPKNADEVSINAYAKLVQINKALRENWQADYDNHNQRKYYPWMTKTGSGLLFVDYLFDFSYSGVGSRLSYPTQEIAEYAGRQFSKEYTEWML